MNPKMIDTIKDAVSNQVRKEAESRGQLTLGMLKGKLSKFNDDQIVVFEQGGSPWQPHSYRGYYDQLALERCEQEKTVEEVLKILDSATGESYTGYKGGSFKMTDYTMVWGSEYGTASGIALVDVKEIEGMAVILTRDTYDES